MMNLLILSFLAILPGSHTVTLNQLSNQISQLNTELSQANHKIELINRKDQFLNGICYTPGLVTCGGGCYCVEDYNLADRFYCDCRIKRTRRDCKEHYSNGERTDGLYLIDNGVQDAQIQVFCDQTTDNGGWTVIQRRVDGSTNFQRDWKSYKNGFGPLQREFWLGNEIIHDLTAQASSVRFDLIRRSDVTKLWAKYSSFTVSNESTKYKLDISGYSGNAADRMHKHNGQRFSTFDQDNDGFSDGNCAQKYYGAWWFKKCHNANLNGAFDPFMKDHRWKSIWWGYNTDDGRMMFSEIKVRRN